MKIIICESSVDSANAVKSMIKELLAQKNVEADIEIFLNSGLPDNMINSDYVDFMLSDSGCYVKIRSDEIVYIESRKNVLYVNTVDRRYKTGKRFDYWQSRLPDKQFYRVHKSYLINTKFITAYKRDSLVLKGDINIPVSRSHQSAFRKRLKELGMI